MTEIRAKTTLTSTPEQPPENSVLVRMPFARLPRPFFARHPRVGYAIFAAALALFLFITWAVLTSSALFAWDMPLGRAVNAWAQGQPAALAPFMRFISTYGRDGVALIMFLLAVGWLRKGARRELWMLFFGVLGAHLWFHILTNLIGRARPEYRDPHETLLGAGYPSGHAATSVVLGMMILYLVLPWMRRSGVRRLYQALLVIGVTVTITLIVFSRLYLSMHYPTDLLAGVVLGIGWGALIFTVTDRYFWRMPA